MSASNLFEAAGLAEAVARPLADKLRPRRLEEVVGQEHLVGPDGTLTRMLRGRSLGSLVFWGPPGTGKTSVARLLADATDLHFQQISAIFSGVAELKKLFETARARRQAGQGTLLFVDEIHRFNRAQQDAFLPVVEDGTIVLVGATTENPSFETARARRQAGQGTLLFVDEIHRFNRAQQDAFLPVVEDGTIVLVGATTENPSFELNAALLSRASVLVFRPLGAAALETLLGRAEAVEGRPLPLDEEARAVLVRMADGDGRAALSLAEEVWRGAGPGEIADAAHLQALLQRRAPIYDKSQDGHYNLISALHKSVRGSDPQAALYYLCRMIDAGEDPMFLARRLIRMAVEDIGLADPGALTIANAAKDAYHMLGSPEGELALAQAAVYLAAAPKSNALYVAYKQAMRTAREAGSLPPPKHILNAPTGLMKAEGYGSGYQYDHDAPEAFSGQDYFPEGLDRQDFYRPTAYGFERELGERLKEWDRLRRQRRQDAD